MRKSRRAWGVLACVLLSLGGLQPAAAQVIVGPPPQPLPPPTVYVVPAPPPAAAPRPMPSPYSQPRTRWNDSGFYCHPLSLLLLAHIGGGAAFSVGRRPSRISYLLDVDTGLECRNAPKKDDKSSVLLLTPELGYSVTFHSPDDTEPGSAALTHLVKFGVGVGYGNLWASINYVPRLVVGARQGELAFGLRHGVVARFVLNMLSLELSHQVLRVQEQTENDLRIVGGVNLLIVLALMKR